MRDGNLDVEEEDSGSESSTDPNRLFWMAEHTADTGGKQIRWFAWKTERRNIFKTVDIAAL